MSSWGRDENEENEEAEEEDDVFKSVNDHLVFLIDARQNMFQKNLRQEVYILNCLKVALAVMKSKIISSEKDTVGIIFYGTESSGSDASKNVLNFLPLGPPSADRILALKNMIDDPSSIPKTFKSQPASTLLCPLKEALWLCTQSFNLKGSTIHKGDFKRVWIFTNDDNPNSHDFHERESTVQVARDGAETGVEISLWHMDRVIPRPDHSGSMTVPFNISNFYSKLLLVNDDDGSGQSEAAYEHRVMGAGSAGGFDELMDLAKRKEYKKRKLGSVRMYISSGLSAANASSSAETGTQIAVSIYKTILPATRPNHVWLQASTSEPAKVSSSYIDASTGQVLQTNKSSGGPADENSASISTPSASSSSENLISTYIDIHGTRVSFTKEEMTRCKMLLVDEKDIEREKQIKAAAESSAGAEGGSAEQKEGAESAAGDLSHELEAKLKVLFFIPKENLTLDMNLTSPCTICPDESSVKGSSMLFAALCDCLIEKSLIGIAAFCRTRSSMPRLVAMLPHFDEEMDESTGRNIVTGMDLVTIPFSNEVRSLEAANMGGVGLEPVTDEEEAAATALVKAMQFDDGFRFQDLQNPARQHMYAVLQAVALNQDSSDWNAETDDMLQPDADGLIQHQALFAALKEATGAAWDGTLGKTSGTKRAAATKDKPAAKKARGAIAADDDGDAGPGFDVNSLRGSTEESLMGNTAVVLKEICRDLGLPVSGTKPVLVQRILAALS